MTVGLSVENQERADFRVPIFLDVPLKHRYIVVAPMLRNVDLSRWLDPDRIEEVTVGGESGKFARPLNFDWVLSLREQCVKAGIPFSFHQTGSHLIKDGRLYTIPREQQHEQARRADVNFRPFVMSHHD